MRNIPMRIIYSVFLFVFFLNGCVFSGDNLVSEKKAQKAQDADSKYPLAPDFRLKDLSGNEFLLSSYRGKEAVVLFFWTTWCPYCREALKDLEEQYLNLAKDGVVVLTVNVGERKNRVAGFMKKRKLSFRVLLDTDYIAADKYELMGVPSYFLINKNGRIISSDNYFPGDKVKEMLDVR
jgi:peroxiredoxin